MRAARLANSHRLQRVLAVLQDGAWHSTMTIIRRANTTAPNSCVSELRENGFTIRTKCERKVWYYKLEPSQ